MTPLLAPLVLLVVMHWSAQFLARQSSRLFGRRMHLYLFGLLGTVIHEGSHVLACLLFRHRIHQVKWFDAQATDGALGSVEHSYNAASSYQRVGTIVIGIAPLLVGAAIILWAAQQLLGVSPSDARGRAFDAPLSHWALFTYVSISVGGSMHLSAADVRGTWRGIVTLAAWSAVAFVLVLLVWWVLQQTAPMVWDTRVAARVRGALRHVTRYSELMSIAMLLAVAINSLCAMGLMLTAFLLRAFTRPVRAR